MLSHSALHWIDRSTVKKKKSSVTANLLLDPVCKNVILKGGRMETFMSVIGSKEYHMAMVK